MRSIIGAYRDSAHARRAVRGLEQHFSVQDVVLLARGEKRPGGSHSLPGEQSERATDVLVVMTGDEASIARARELLRATP
jgi:hypothetical protein